MKKILSLVLILFCSSVVFSQTKDWIGKSWNDGEKFYFSGMSESNASLKKAEELAYNDAVLNAAKYLGVKISNQTSSQINNDDINLREQTVTFLDDTFISSAIVKEFYYEEKNDRYISYILLEIDKTALEKEQNRKDNIKQQEKEKVTKQKLLIEENRTTGEYNITISNKLEIIKTEIEGIFENCGYNITENKNKNIKQISIKILNEQVENVIDDMLSYSIKISVKVNNKSFILKSKKVSEDDINIAKQLVYKDILNQLNEKLKKNF